MTTQHKLALQAGRERYQQQLREAKEDAEYAKYIRRLNAVRKRMNKQKTKIGYTGTQKTLSREQFHVNLNKAGSVGKLVRMNLRLLDNDTAAYLVRKMYEEYNTEITFEEARNVRNLGAGHPIWRKIKEFYEAHGKGLAKGEKSKFAAQEFFGS